MAVAATGNELWLGELDVSVRSFTCLPGGGARPYRDYRSRRGLGWGSRAKLGVLTSRNPPTGKAPASGTNQGWRRGSVIRAYNPGWRVLKPWVEARTACARSRSISATM